MKQFIIDDKFAAKLKEMKYEFSVQVADHPYCFGRDCEGEHTETELSVWRVDEPQFKRSFARPEYDWVIENLTKDPKINPFPLT